MAFLLPNSVFIHIPKTGGQWVTRALDNAGLLVGGLGVVHTSPDEIREEAEFMRRRFVFAMVRHPMSWYVSMWAHRMDEEWEAIDDLQWFTPRWVEFWAEFTEVSRAETFDQHLRQIIDHYPQGFVSMLFDAYTEGCTHVGRQERLQEDLIDILGDAGEAVDYERLLSTRERNVRGRSRHGRLATALNPELVAAVMRAESSAVERFGYHQTPAWLEQA